MLKDTLQIISAILVVIIVSQGIAYINISGINDEVKEGNFMLVEIEHRNSEGILLDTICINDDLLLRNFAYWLINLNSGSDYIDARDSYKPQDTTGGLITTMNAFTTIPQYATVYIGEGTTAPVITDYVLETPAMSEYVTDRLYWNTGTQFNITIDSLFLIDSTYAITEIGLSVYLNTKFLLIARDTFTVINVNAGDTLTTRYFLLANWGG